MLRPWEQRFKDFQCRRGIFHAEPLSECLIPHGDDDAHIPATPKRAPGPIQCPPDLVHGAAPSLPVEQCKPQVPIGGEAELSMVVERDLDPFLLPKGEVVGLDA